MNNSFKLDGISSKLYFVLHFVKQITFGSYIIVYAKLNWFFAVLIFFLLARDEQFEPLLWLEIELKDRKSFGWFSLFVEL